MELRLAGTGRDSSLGSIGPCTTLTAATAERRDLTFKGPGGGLLPKYIDIVVGRMSKADIEEDYPITWDVV